MKQMPMIEKFMTPMPHSINPKMKLKVAMKMMRDHQIRHLPVEHGGELVGMVTDRDIKLASTLAGAEEITVEDAMTPDPYTVLPESPLDRVVFEMAEHKYGSAVVRQGNGKVIGIFTAVDGLRALGEVLQGNYKPIAV